MSRDSDQGPLSQLKPTPWNFPSEAVTGAWEGVLGAADFLVHELPSAWVFIPLVLEATVHEFLAPSGTHACLEPPHPDKPGRDMTREGDCLQRASASSPS